MNSKSPQMKSMFGGTPSGGFFDLPTATAGETRNADIGGRGALGAARIVAMVMGLAARQRSQAV